MYKILRELGRGSFAVVYLLQTPESDEYALKKVALKSTDGDIYKEGRILASLCHPHLVKCYTFFERHMALYLITEYCSHGTLKHYIDQQLERKQYIAEKTVSKMLCQLSDVLRYLNAEKIIHRDLKPDNIFLGRHKSIKVGDIGVARELDYTSQKASTMAGAIIYMSPEIREGLRYTSQTDIWSLGCCLHELMTLKRTFQSWNDLYEINIPPMPHDVYCVRLQSLVLDMLERDPNDRPDAYELFQLACAIRGKRYEPDSVETNINFTVDPKEVCRAVSRFCKSDSLNRRRDNKRKPSGDDCDSDSESKEVGDKTMATAIDVQGESCRSSSHKPFGNLTRDTFGTLPRSKMNRRRKGHHTLSAEGEDFTDRCENIDGTFQGYDMATGADSLEDDYNSYKTQSSSGRLNLEEEESWASSGGRHSSDSDNSVTLYTRAQLAKYKNRSIEEMSTSDLARSTELVFAGQSDNLRELMQRRVTGYAVNGEDMLRHKPF